MTTALAKALVVDETKMYRGENRVLLGTLGTTVFPDTIEDIISLTTFLPTTNWVDLGVTSTDGITIERSQDVDEGIEIDQRDYALRRGRLSNISYTITGSLMYTDNATLKKVWNSPLLTTIAAVSGTNVAQTVIDLGSPPSLTRYPIAILQQDDKSGKIKAYVFRQAMFTETGGIAINRSDPSMLEITMEVDPDTSQTDGTDFGRVFETT